MANDASQVAGWMLEQFDRLSAIDPLVLIPQIREQFGDTFVELDERDTPVISRKVMKEFGKLTQGTITWDDEVSCWRRVE